MSVFANDISELVKTAQSKNGDLSVSEKTTPLVDSSMDVKVITTEEEFDELEPHWDNLLEQPEVEADIFQTFNWQRLWWKYFGYDNTLHILTVWMEDRLVGLAPFFVDHTSVFGMYEHPKLKFIGASIPNKDAVGAFTHYSISDYLDIVIHPEYQKIVINACIGYLDRTRRFVDGIELNELSEESTFLKAVLPEIREQGWRFEKREREVCPQIKLPATVDEYLDDLHRKARYKLRYSKRAVTEKELFKVYRVNSQSDLDSAFQNFVTLHQDRWNKRGFPGIFANERFKDFLRDIGQAFVNSGKLKMSTAIDNDDQCIAVNFAFQFKGRVYDYQKAFDDESDLAKYSPGKALTYFLIEDAIENGSQWVDLLRGGEKYKLRFTNHTTRNWMVFIPGHHHQKNVLKDSLYHVVQVSNGIKEQLSRELLLLKVHVNQWGLGGFLPHYMNFIKERIANKV